MEKTYRIPALEAIARINLKEYDPSLLSGPPCAVPIEKLARWLGLSIEYQCLRKNGVYLGEMVYDTGLVPVYTAELKRYELITVPGKTIILDESLLCGGDGRLCFTCAHEIAHWLIHQEVYAGTGKSAASVNPHKSSEENPFIERQADTPVTMLLMPAVQVKRAFYTLRNKPNPTDRLASLFGVSKKAMDIFLRDHRLI